MEVVDHDGSMVDTRRAFLSSQWRMSAHGIPRQHFLSIMLAFVQPSTPAIAPHLLSLPSVSTTLLLLCSSASAPLLLLLCLPATAGHPSRIAANLAEQRCMSFPRMPLPQHPAALALVLVFHPSFLLWIAWTARHAADAMAQVTKIQASAL